MTTPKAELHEGVGGRVKSHCVISVGARPMPITDSGPSSDCALSPSRRARRARPRTRLHDARLVRRVIVCSYPIPVLVFDTPPPHPTQTHSNSEEAERCSDALVADEAIAFDSRGAVAAKHMPAIRGMLFVDELETDGAFKRGRGGSL